jgi:hypothetical protein
MLAHPSSFLFPPSQPASVCPLFSCPTHLYFPSIHPLIRLVGLTLKYLFSLVSPFIIYSVWFVGNIQCINVAFLHVIHRMSPMNLSKLFFNKLSIFGCLLGWRASKIGHSSQNFYNFITIHKSITIHKFITTIHHKSHNKFNIGKLKAPTTYFKPTNLFWIKSWRT